MIDNILSVLYFCVFSNALVSADETNAINAFQGKCLILFHIHEALPGVGGYLFSCSPEINWLVPLFPKIENLLSYVLCSPVTLKIWLLFP